MIIIYHCGEENVIKNTLSQINYPNTVAIILNQLSNNYLIVRTLVNFIRWSKYAKIKHLIIYDPFSVLSSDKIKSLCKILEDNFTEKYSIGISYGEFAYNLKEKKEINHQEMFSYGFDMVLSIIDFKSANNNFINELVSSDDNYVNIGTMQLQYYKKLNQNKQTQSTSMPYEKYYTRKKVIGLPEVVLTFDNNEICLYGFPFALLENSEITTTNCPFVSFDVLKFVKVFKINATIQKRFGV